MLSHVIYREIYYRKNLIRNIEFRKSNFHGLTIQESSFTKDKRTSVLFFLLYTFKQHRCIVVKFVDDPCLQSQKGRDFKASEPVEINLI